jgi:hypothetical protein
VIATKAIQANNGGTMNPTVHGTGYVTLFNPRAGQSRRKFVRGAFATYDRKPSQWPCCVIVGAPNIADLNELRQKGSDPAEEGSLF